MLQSCYRVSTYPRQAGSTAVLGRRKLWMSDWCETGSQGHCRPWCPVHTVSEWVSDWWSGWWSDGVSEWVSDGVSEWLIDNPIPFDCQSDISSWQFRGWDCQSAEQASQCQGEKDCQWKWTMIVNQTDNDCQSDGQGLSISCLVKQRGAVEIDLKFPHVLHQCALKAKAELPTVTHGGYI